MTRLGEGQGAAGRLLDDLMRRTGDTVAEFIAAAERLGASEVHVVATSAVREAEQRDGPVHRDRRADVLVPGIIICLAIMERLGYESLVVSNRSLREGIVYGLLSAL